MFVYVNDGLVDESEAVVSVYDHGFLYGDGIYETLRSYRGVVWLLDRHLERLYRSASLTGLRLPTEDALRKAVYQTLTANNLEDAYIRVTVSRGRGPIGLDPDLCPKATLVVIAEQFREYPAALYERGMKVIIAETRRNLKQALNPQIKSLNFLNNILAKIEAKKKEADEAVLLNADGFLTEGTVSNIFFVLEQGLLCTPSVDAGILDGITREVVIRLARKRGMQVEEGLYYPSDILRATEVFLTNTTTEVMPVSLVDDRSFLPGETARSIREAYRTEVEEYVRKHVG